MKLADCIIKNPAYTLVVLSGAVAVLFLSVALVAQYGFNQHPCHLCIAQRVPYALIVVVSIFASILKLSPQRMEQLVMLCALLFLTDAGIAVYHSGVELGYFPGPSGCTNNDKPGATIEEMRAAIMNAALVPCDQPMVYILGLSMASWNAIAALCSAIGTWVGFRKMQKISTKN